METAKQSWKARLGARWRLLVVGLVAWCSAVAPVSAQAVRGRVVAAEDRPIEHARVELAGSSAAVFSDPDGYFALDHVEFPATLVVEHPRFEPALRELAEAAVDLVIRLTAKREVYESIAVSANRGVENFAPVSVASSVIEPGTASVPASNVTELVAETAAVSENGQGGVFQTWSIRGVARQRVLTLVSGMKVVGERRAGVSASFVDPSLVGSIDVVRGPSSTYYGSGALGGVVQLFPRHFERSTIATGFDSRGDERHVLIAGGSPGRSWGIARRQADDSKTPDGERLASRFRLTSGSVRALWEKAGLGLSASILGSLASDIGKANTDFPERKTTYPDERHAIIRIGVERPASWRLEAAVHPNSLETRVADAESVSDLENDALDLAVSWQRRTHGPEIGALRFGADYFGRRSVDALEERIDLANGGPSFVQRTLDSAREDELGAFGAWEWNAGPAVVIIGGRLAWQRQQNAGDGKAEDEAVTGFAGAVVPIGAGFELTANAGSGLRFPSLSERFFTGVTGRGFVVGNPGLAPERSLNLDTGLRYYGERLYLAASAFRNEIDDYIERIELTPDRLTFVNLSSGVIEGLEVEVLAQLDARWSVAAGAHVIEGQEEDGEALADVPADRLYLGLKGEAGNWSYGVRWESRASKNDPGSGEKAIPAADLVTGSVRYRIRPGMTVQAAVRNALDDEYFASADSKAPLAPGRSLSVGVRWTNVNVSD